MIERRGRQESKLAAACIALCLVEIIFGSVSALLFGSAKSDAASFLAAYNRTGERAVADGVEFHILSELAQRIDYNLCMGASITILAFVRLVLHIIYQSGRQPKRAVFIMGVATALGFMVFLASLNILPRQAEIFVNHSGSINQGSEAWVMKLRDAWIYLMMAFGLWIITLVLAVCPGQSYPSTSSYASVPHPSPPKCVKMRDVSAAAHPAPIV